MLLLGLSVLLAILPLAGIAGLVVTGNVRTVDGLFFTLMLLTLSGVFALNCFWEIRDRGWLPFLNKKKAAAPPARAQAQAQKATS